jgi:cysteine desulfurase family protein
VPIYLDNAATSFPKPESVYAAIDRTNRKLAVATGRGRYQRANDADRLVNQARRAVAHLIGAETHQISFAFSGSDALSTAILGYLKPGDHAIASAADHTSVLRPLWHLEQNKQVELTVVDCNENGLVNANEIKSAINSNTKMVCLTHASNVTGVIQPTEAIGEICKANEIAFLLDAAQTIGHLKFDFRSVDYDFLAVPGHKSLLGPMGTGFLFASDKVAEDCGPLRFGGTGSTGNEFDQPKSCPQKFESGNLNLPGIAGLLAGIQWLETDEAIANSDRLDQLTRKLSIQLSEIEHVTVYGLDKIQTPTVSFNIAGTDCQTVGMLLDSQFEIECRTGLHCAPLIHDKIGSAEFGGTVRFSPGVFSTEEEIDKAISAVRRIAREMGASNQ